MKRTKIWFGVGAFVIAGAGATNTASADAGTFPTRGVDPQTQTSANAIQVAQHGEGGERSKRHGGAGEGGERSRAPAAAKSGEGGEGGEGGLRGLSPDLDFALKIALMRGHLLAGHHLVQEKRWDNAYEHFLHPGAELYGGIRNRLKAYGVPPFETRLKVLANVVRQRKSGPEYTAARDEVLKALDAADAAVFEKQTDVPVFKLGSALEVLKVGADEYNAALDKKRIVNRVEYQDARAFVLVAERLVEDSSAALEKKDAKALDSVRAAIGRLKSALSAPVPPPVAPLDYGSFLADVSRVELAAGSLLR
jgi:hypothetical protein